MTNDLKNLLPRDSKKVRYSRGIVNRAGGLKPTLLLVLFAAIALIAVVLAKPFVSGGQSSSSANGNLSGAEETGAVSPGAESTAQDSETITTPTVVSYQLEDKVKNGDTFETIMLRNGIGRDYLFPLLNAARDSHNLNRVVIGRQFKFAFVDSLLTQVVYEIDNDRTLLVTLEDSVDWQAEVEETRYIENERELTGTIESSLYQTVMETYGNPELALKLSEIYAWQIDFHNDIRKGDSFRLIFREKIHPAKQVTKVSEILAVQFVNAGREIYSFRFMNPDSTVDYFEPDGKSLRRKFLRSPFKYMPRISSRYNPRRFHPILKRYRPHLGVDYAAPKGTPVLALGDGKVVKRGWNGGFGNYILVRHNGMYSTGYGHLSGYARGLKVGSRVRQGEVIGYVGSTGLSTGPHLDFRFFKNSKPVNPLKVDIPAGEPVVAEVFAEFEAYRDMMKRRLDRIGQPLFGPPLVATSTKPVKIKIVRQETVTTGG